MADVTSQMEANGLPTQFESSSNQPEVTHSTANAEAVISNAEASQIKQNAPGIEVTMTAQPVQPVESSAEPKSEAAQASSDVSISDTAAATEPAQVNGHSQQDSAPPAVDAVPAQESVTEPVTDSVLPPVADATVAQAVTDAPEAIMPEAAQPSSLPEQAPISDLRTTPHSDALDASAVAKIEAAKHEIDNNAEQVPAELTSTEAPAVPSIPQEDTIMTEQPAASPPATDSLPATQTSEPNGTIVPSVEAVTLEAGAEKPAAPAPTPAVSATFTNDQEMTDAPLHDAPQQAVKHDRDEDVPEEPSAKRMRTDEDSEDTPLAQISASTGANNTPAPTGEGDDAVTPARLGWMKKTISNLKKSSASVAFRLPVDPVALNIPHYPDVIKKPMDLQTIDAGLKNGKYTSVAAFKADFDQIVLNCITFNGKDHAVTASAQKMAVSFNSQMAKLPPAIEPEPVKASKQKLEPIRAPPPRRQSVTAKAASPKATSPATFAPDPNGVPLIRRDSAIDGRPKRAIVPPKRNSDFGGARPRKKKYELELRFCDEVLKQITATKNWTANQYFMHPVDPVALNIPTYFQVVKKPMDLMTIKSKLEANQYERAKEFEEDVRLIFKNCYKFNQPGDYVHQRGEELERLFNKEWEKKQDWIAAREPDSEPASVKSEEESDEEEEAESDEEAGRDDEIAKLQAQLELMQNQMMELKSKKNKSPGASKSKKGSDKKAKKPTSKFPGLQQKSDKAKKPAKKAKAERERFVSFAEKQYISNGIAMLPERPMQEALRIIQTSVPQLTNSESGEIELDIEEVPNHALLKLLEHVKKYAGPPPEETKQEEYSAPAVTTSKKKSKSLTKHEQEAQIASLRGQLQTYDKGSSPDAMQSVENGDDSDNDSNEESEEE